MKTFAIIVVLMTLIVAFAGKHAAAMGACVLLYALCFYVLTNITRAAASRERAWLDAMAARELELNMGADAFAWGGGLTAPIFF